MTDRDTDVQAWMTSYLADLLDIPEAEVDPTRPFDQYGLDSAAAVAFTSDLGHWLGVQLDTRLMIENDTIAAVARHLAARPGGARATA